MAKKLAITIAGAVSLGSYEAGTIFEIFDALSQHNKWASDNNLPDERIEVDVLTGASAGGQCVAIIAQRLLFEGDTMGAPYNNPLYNAWVQDIDISGLLDRAPDEPVTHSIFSSDCIISISQKYLMGRYAANPTIPRTDGRPHSALSSDGRLHLGFALSNLHGVDYCRNTASGGRFIYTDHQDQLLVNLDASADDRPELWEAIRATAVACGAFPFAFRVQDLARNIVDYPSDFLVKELWRGNPSRYFTYTDGGIFQNEPIGMAKNLVELLPDGRLHALNRGYLFIAPQPKASKEIEYTNDPNADPAKFFGTAVADFKVVLERIAFSIMGQAGFRDWIIAEDVNKQIHFLDKRADQLQQLFIANKLTAAHTIPVSDALLEGFFAENGVMTPAASANLNAAREQLQKQYASEYATFGADAATANAWLDSVLVLELAAGLHEKEEMLIYDFVADTGNLAGYGLESFQGFFDVTYRKHDYDYGRTMAQQKLAQYQTQKGGIFANLHWTPSRIDPIDPNLNGIDMSAVDQSKREQVKDQLIKAADDLLQELGIDLAIRKIVEFTFVDRRIKRLLSL